MRGSIILIFVVMLVVGFFAYNFFTGESEISPQGDLALSGKPIEANDFLQNQARSIVQKTEDFSKMAETKAGQLTEGADDAFASVKNSEALAEIEKKIEETTPQILDTKKATESLNKVEKDLGSALSGLTDLAEDEESVLSKNATRIAEKLKELIAKAKAHLEKGEFNEAMAAAKDALNINPNSEEAKGILQTAQEKLTSMTAQKAEEFKTGVSDKVGDTKSALGSLGGQ